MATSRRPAGAHQHRCHLSSGAARLMEGVAGSDSADESTGEPEVALDQLADSSARARDLGEEEPLVNPQPQTGGAWAGLNRKLALSLLASSVCASFQHGYNGGVVNAPQQLLSQFIGSQTDSQPDNNNNNNNKEQVRLVLALVVSAFCVGGCLGALLTAPVAEWAGRKGGLMYSNLVVLIACPLMGSSRWLASYELLIAGRLLVGVSAGLGAGLAPLYVAEVAPSHLRGPLGALYQLGLTCSMLVSSLLGLPWALGSAHWWPYLFLVPLLPGGLGLALLARCPESPRHLLLVRGRELEAQQALAWLRGSPELIQHEMEELRGERDRLHLSWGPPTLRQMLAEPHLSRPLQVAAAVMLSQQLSGINAVLFYSTPLFRWAGLGPEAAAHATLASSLLNVLVTLISCLLVDRVGRKRLHLLGLLGMGASALLLAGSLGGPQQVGPLEGARGLLACLAIYLFVGAFALGPGSVPWLLVGELFAAPARPLAASLAVSLNWLANFAVSITFLPLSDLLHGHAFLLFALILFAFALYTCRRVPETRGASPDEMAAIFRLNQ